MSLIISIIVIDSGIYFYLSDNSQKSHYKTDLFDNSETKSLNIVMFYSEIRVDNRAVTNLILCQQMEIKVKRLK